MASLSAIYVDVERDKLPIIRIEWGNGRFQSVKVVEPTPDGVANALVHAARIVYVDKANGKI